MVLRDLLNKAVELSIWQIGNKLLTANEVFATIMAWVQQAFFEASDKHLVQICFIYYYAGVFDVSLLRGLFFFVIGVHWLVKLKLVEDMFIHFLHFKNDYIVIVFIVATLTYLYLSLRIVHFPRQNRHRLWHDVHNFGWWLLLRRSHWRLIRHGWVCMLCGSLQLETNHLSLWSDSDLVFNGILRGIKNCVKLIYILSFLYLGCQGRLWYLRLVTELRRGVSVVLMVNFWYNLINFPLRSVLGLPLVLTFFFILWDFSQLIFACLLILFFLLFLVVVLDSDLLDVFLELHQEAW